MKARNVATVLALAADEIRYLRAQLKRNSGFSDEEAATARKVLTEAERERDEARNTLAADVAAAGELEGERRRNWEDVLSRLAVAEQEREEAYVSNGKLQGNLAATEQIAANLREERRVLAEALARAVRAGCQLDERNIAALVLTWVGEPEDTAQRVVACIVQAESVESAAPLIEGCLAHRKREA